ncbi:MAG: tetratricopeptide repeat-containing sulfotransferase family protein [Planctomycetota bacterium]|jgi:tetratricopeptide (TPR) repeat protein
MAFLEQHATFDQAASFLRAGDLEQAEAICKQLLKRDKRDADALQLRGTISLKRRDYAGASKHYARCLAIKPREPRFHFLAGRVAALQGRYGEAVRKLDKALQLEAGYEPAVVWKAKVLEWDGAYEQARALLEPFVAGGRENVEMAEIQAKVDTHDGRFGEAARIAERHLARADLPADTRHRLGHVAGNAYEKAGEYDKAFEAHTEANRAVAIPFDRHAYARSVDRLTEVFSAAFVGDISRHGSGSQLPVFIAGMPRSGTTLVEQIIDAHSQAHGAGELQDLEAVAAGLQVELGSTEPYPGCAEDLDADGVTRLGKRYLDSLRRTARTPKRIVNKSLENYRNLGLIGVLFPAAPIIHCFRDPRDTCVSCYMSNILPGPHPYISDLGDLGFAYGRYEQLMAHWKHALRQPILEVGYEALVDNLEGESRRIIEHVGLEWDDACLQFHATGRVVRTASYEQVRQPIYRSSIGRYKRFERHLGALIEALSEASTRLPGAEA